MVFSSNYRKTAARNVCFAPGLLILLGIVVAHDISSPFEKPKPEGPAEDELFGGWKMIL